MAKFRDQEPSEDRKQIVIVPEVVNELWDKIKKTGLDITEEQTDKIFRSLIDILISKYNMEEIQDYFEKVSKARARRRSLI